MCKIFLKDTMSDKKIGFLVDLPMVFSIVKLDDLVKSANTYYNTNIFIPKVGNFGYSKDEAGKDRVFFLYKVMAKRLDESDKMIGGQLSSIDIKIQKVGTFTNLYEILNSANSTTIFQSLNEANVFLKAIIKSDPSIENYDAYLCLDSEIQGI